MSIITTGGFGWDGRVNYESGDGSIGLSMEGSTYRLRIRTGDRWSDYPQYDVYTLTPEQVKFFGYLSQFRVFENANG